MATLEDWQSVLRHDQNECNSVWSADSIIASQAGRDDIIRNERSEAAMRTEGEEDLST